MPGVFGVDIKEKGSEVLVAGYLSNESQSFEEFLFTEYLVVLVAEEIIDFKLGGLNVFKVTLEYYLILGKRV